MKKLIALFAVLIAATSFSFAVETCDCTGNATFDALVVCCPTISAAVYTPDNDLGTFFPSTPYTLAGDHYAEFRLNGDPSATYVIVPEDLTGKPMNGTWMIKWDGPLGGHMYYHTWLPTDVFKFLKNDNINPAIQCTGNTEAQPILKFTPTWIQTGSALGEQHFPVSITITATV